MYCNEISCRSKNQPTLPKAMLCIIFGMISLHAIELPQETDTQKIGITYAFSGGRFGDNLLSYLHAKWWSFTYQIPLLYQPFRYSPNLILHEKELHYKAFSFRLRIPLMRWPIHVNSTLPTLIYVCPYFPENIRECLSQEEAHLPSEYPFSFQVDWTNPAFRNLVLPLIAPKTPLQLTLPPKDCISIAIHIREGGHYDDDRTKISYPLKLPPFTFYVEGLRSVLQLLDRSALHQLPLYCHIFTDAQYPEAIAKHLCQEFPDLSFHFRSTNNRHDLNILEDFFSLFHFDILIHPLSNFSLIPGLLHDYLITLRPKQFSRVQGQPVRITETELCINDALCKEKLCSF